MATPEPAPAPDPLTALPGPGAATGDAEGFELVASAGLPVVPWRRVTTREDAVAAAAALGPLVAMKLSADGIVHKSDLGGVHLALSDTASVEAAWDDLSGIAGALGVPPRALVQQMAPTGVEVIVGSKLDPAFGPVVMVGAGGIHAEVLKDVQIRLAPVSEAAAKEMIGALKIAPVLEGARGRTPADIDALATVVSRLSAAAAAWQGSIAEIDLNPVIVLDHGEGVRLVDVAMVPTTPTEGH